MEKNEETIEKSELYKKIEKIIIKYGTFAYILEYNCNSVFNTDKIMMNISIVDSFIKKIKFILQDEYKNENVKYVCINKFIDDFLFYIDNKKTNSNSNFSHKRTFNKSSDIETFIVHYPNEEFNQHKLQFVEKFNDYYI